MRVEDLKNWRAEATGIEGERDYRAACSGPDLDAIVRDLFRTWLLETGRSPEDIALSVRMEPKEIRAFLRGKPGTLALLTRICASAGMSVTQLFSLDEDYRAMTGGKVSSLKRALLSRLESMMTTEEVQATYAWHEMCRDLPEFNACLLTGFRLALDLAEKQGLPVEHPRALVDKVWRQRVAPATGTES